eukprot:1340954-Pleurochrysis_carterae.AAC.1
MSSRAGPRSPSSVTPRPSRSSRGATAVSAPSPPPRGGCASSVRGCRAEAPGVHGPPAGAPSAARRVEVGPSASGSPSYEWPLRYGPLPFV